MHAKNVLAAVAAACLCVLLAGVALQERASRSPAALLAQGGKQGLYGYYPYPYGSNGYGYGDDAQYGGGGYPSGYGGGYGGGYPYYAGYGGYPYGGGYGYPYYAYDEDNAYQQYASQEQYRQWADYAAQQQYADSAAQANYYNWAAANAYKQENKGDVLKVAGSKSKAQSLVYMGDLEFGGYRHEITGGNDGGYNAPFDINGDGQEIDNWAKVITQWKHKKGGKQLKQKKLQQLHYLSGDKARAQASAVFDGISGSEHGANNHHLKHRVVKQRQAKHAPLYVDRNSGYTTSNPKLIPSASPFATEGSGDVSIKARKLQQLAAAERSEAEMKVAKVNALKDLVKHDPKIQQKIDKVHREWKKAGHKAPPANAAEEKEYDALMNKVVGHPDVSFQYN